MGQPRMSAEANSCTEVASCTQVSTMFKLMRSLTAASLGLFLSLAGHAQTWPSRPITLVVPAAPGTAADLIGRKLGEHLSGELGQPVVVDNRLGAGGTVA